MASSTVFDPIWNYINADTQAEASCGKRGFGSMASKSGRESGIRWESIFQETTSSTGDVSDAEPRWRIQDPPDRPLVRPACRNAKQTPSARVCPLMGTEKPLTYCL